MARDFVPDFDPRGENTYAAEPMMFDPAHPGEIMREILDNYGFSVTKAAAASRLQRTHLSAMLSGEKPVTIESAMKFEAAFGGPAPTVLHGMSDLYESTKALRRKDEIVRGIERIEMVAETA